MNKQQISNLKPGVVDAINSLLAMHDAIADNKLSINDLTEGLAMAIEDGHDMAILALSMMTCALELDKNR